jgi:nicotinamidase/pyrazinamidase
LPVIEGDLVVEPANQLIRRFEERRLPIYITRDWHPPNHCSFREFGGPWPAHCIAGTEGAAFHEKLHVPGGVGIISKATTPEREAFSDFDGSDLDRRLNAMNVDHLVVVGLATDYCVKATVLDALAEGFRVSVVIEGIRPVNMKVGDGAKAVEEMRHCGARFVKLAEVLERL